MKSLVQSLPVLLSAIVILVLLGEVVRMRGLRSHWTLVAYLAAQFLATAIMWISAQRIPRGSQTYSAIYGCSYMTALMIGILLCSLWSSDSKAWLGSIAGFGLGAMVIGYLLPKIPLPVTEELEKQNSTAVMVSIIAGTFVAIGVWALFCAVEGKTPVDTTIMLLLAAFWILEGGFLFANIAAKVNVNFLWVRDQRVFAPAIAILIFGFMAWHLGKAQMETSRASVQPDVHVAEAIR